MEKRRIRCLAFPFITVCVLCLVVFMIVLNVFLLVFEPSRMAFLEHIPMFICWIIFTYGLTIATLVLMAKPLLSIINIDETGVSRAFLGKFWKLHISWDDMAEARFYTAVSNQMVFSKTKKLGAIPMGKWHKEKDIIFVGFSKKRYEVISLYLQQSMVGMPVKLKDKLSQNNTKS
ncbi:MAG: hypothetical protein K2M89_01320 [Clostridiales bacterium]|nr:hypothetical protein [Clostridiales bacterium]